MEKKLKHLEFIQGSIDRMASNLFLLKGWTVTLIAALFALAAKDSKDVYFLIAYLPACMFWILDAYFLSLERQFRALYDDVRGRDESTIDFAMSPAPYKHLPNNSWFATFKSPSLVIYYGGLVVTMLVVSLSLKFS